MADLIRTRPTPALHQLTLPLSRQQHASCPSSMHVIRIIFITVFIQIDARPTPTLHQLTLLLSRQPCFMSQLNTCYQGYLYYRIHSNRCSTDPCSLPAHLTAFTSTTCFTSQLNACYQAYFYYRIHLSRSHQDLTDPRSLPAQVTAFTSTPCFMSQLNALSLIVLNQW